MARSRVIRPQFAEDEKLARISRDARLLFVLLWTVADDAGRVRGNPVWLKNQVFPYDRIHVSKFVFWLQELVKMRAILPYEVSGESYFFIRKFNEHQVINRPSKPVYPPPPDDILDDSVSDHGVISEPSPLSLVKYSIVESRSIGDEQSAAEPPPPSLPPLLKIPLKTGKNFSVTQGDVDQWQSTYPNIDVKAVLLQVRQWNIDNPTKRKTKSGIRAHINRWLKSENDRGGTSGQTGRVDLYETAKSILEIDGENNFLAYCAEKKLDPEEARRWNT